MAAMMLIAPPWWETATHILSLGAAYALALPVGWTEKDERSAGIRTFPLVAIASCGFVLVGIAILGRTSPAQARSLKA
jgi:putative Mg2+ transporter-C (MgtC) family protein